MSNMTRDETQAKLRLLFEEHEALDADISAKIQRLKEINNEVTILAKKLQEFASQPVVTPVNIVNGVQTTPHSTGFYVKNGAKIKHGSIKDFVVQVLSDSKGGMIALDILSEINDRFNKNYTRPSLSPQLSRLKDEGVLDLRGSVWYIKPQNDIFD